MWCPGRSHSESARTTKESRMSRLLHENAGQRTFALVLATGDEAMRCLQSFVARERVSAAQISAIGAFSEAVLGYFDWEKKEYRRNPVSEQLEVASLLGDVALSPEGEPALHLHAVLGRRDGTALAGPSFVRACAADARSHTHRIARALAKGSRSAKRPRLDPARRRPPSGIVSLLVAGRAFISGAAPPCSHAHLAHTPIRW